MTGDGGFVPDEIPVTGRLGTAPEIATFCHIQIGNREYQQDAVYATPSQMLAANKTTRSLGIICDGMGGMTDGGWAAQTALNTFVQAFGKIEKEKEVSIPTFFKQGIIATDRMISEHTPTGQRGSGTTLVAAVVENDHFYWASVGDSRIYKIGGGMMQQLTRDHNYDLRLRQMLEEGKLTQEEYATKRQKEALISFLGIGNISLMDITPEPIPLQEGDAVLLCSDGITKTLSDEQIYTIVTGDLGAGDDPARRLVDAAIRSNTRTQDNTSAVLMRYQMTNI